MKRLLIVGAGVRDRSLAEAVFDGSIFQLARFLNNEVFELSQLWGWLVFRPVADLARRHQPADAAIVAIRNNRLSEEFHLRLHVAGFESAKVFHDQALVSPWAVTGAVKAIMAGGSVLGLGAWMQAGPVLGYGVRIGAGFVLKAGQVVSETSSRNALQ